MKTQDKRYCTENVSAKDRAAIKHLNLKNIKLRLEIALLRKRCCDEGIDLPRDSDNE